MLSRMLVVLVRCRWGVVLVFLVLDLVVFVLCCGFNVGGGGVGTSGYHGVGARCFQYVRFSKVSSSLLFLLC